MRPQRQGPSMPQVEIALTIQVRSALALRGAAADGGRGPGTGRGGRLVLPGSQVKGRLRHACGQVARALGGAICRPPDPAAMCPHAPGVAAPPCAVSALFGARGWPGPRRWGDPRAGSPAGPVDTARRVGLTLDRRRRTALPGSAYAMETSPVLPDGLQFVAARAISGDVADAASLQLLLA